MPSADFCAAIRRPFDLLSRFSDTAQTSRGKTNSLPHPPPNLRSAFLVNMDFVVDRPLVRRSRLISGSCSSVHAFAPRFLQTPPRDDALALRYPFTSTWLERGLSPPSCRSCPAHDPSTRSHSSPAQDDRLFLMRRTPSVGMTCDFEVDGSPAQDENSVTASRAAPTAKTCREPGPSLHPTRREMHDRRGFAQAPKPPTSLRF